MLKSFLSYLYNAAHKSNHLFSSDVKIWLSMYLSYFKPNSVGPAGL